MSLLPPSLQTLQQTPLLLLTSVISAPASWLSQAIVAQVLTASPSSTVIIASWTQDAAFWNEGMKKVGVDLPGMERRARVVFVDGLVGDAKKAVEKVKSEVARVGQRGTVVLEGLEYLVAAGVTGLGEVLEMVGGVQEVAASTIVQTYADTAFMTPHTRLEKDVAALVKTIAHGAGWVCSVRGLETGVARDVGGVLRITRGGGNVDGVVGVEEKEWLWVVGEGGGRIFDRGRG
ncbi:hypothetical protein RUND412_009684 [Rhizina undulata]